jgi:hypothetical protein
MKLDAWMEQDHPLDESLRLIESLCQAVNEVHDRGEYLGGLAPDRIEVTPGWQCDLSETRGATPAPAYAPPDGEGDAAADVFAAGMIVWEILAGRSAGESPQHLSEVRPDISKELADAIMACLERSADWRPKDLTFLAQMAGVRQKTAPRGAPRGRSTRSARTTPTRKRPRREGGRTWPLLAALVVVVGLGAFAWKQFFATGEPSGTPAPPPPAATAVPPAAPGVEPTPPADESPSPVDAPPPPAATEAATGAQEPVTAPPEDTAPQAPPPAAPEPVSAPESAPAPPPSAAPPPAVAPPPAQTARPEPAPPSQPTLPPASTAPAAPAAPQPQTTSPATSPAAPPPPADTAATAPAAPEPPPDPATLTAVSPLEVKRPGKVMVDLRGQGFRDQHRVLVLPVKKAPRGITVVRAKRVNDTTITVLIDLTADADTGEYGIAVEDERGTRTEALVFKVTK